MAVFISKYIICYLHFIIIGCIHLLYHIIFIFIVVTAIYLKIFPWNKSGFFGGYNTAFYYFFSAFIYFFYMIPVCYLLQTAVFSLDIAYVGNMKRIQYPAGRQFLFSDFIQIKSVRLPYPGFGRHPLSSKLRCMNLLYKCVERLVGTKKSG